MNLTEHNLIDPFNGFYDLTLQIYAKKYTQWYRKFHNNGKKSNQICYVWVQLPLTILLNIN